jgi:hypothetical protein
MKIIGRTEKGFILDATKQEVAHLIGFCSGFDIGHIEVGLDIEINQMYNQLYDLSHMENELQQIADRLERYASLLRPLMPIHIECPTEG